MVTCVLLARTAVAALASVLASRRFRDLLVFGGRFFAGFAVYKTCMFQ